ncbi:MAG: transglutaminase family protein [Limnohabitans sp.]|nr:transglutaminase family protein [Limnohabitans sp.]
MIPSTAKHAQRALASAVFLLVLLASSMFSPQGNDAVASPMQSTPAQPIAPNPTTAQPPQPTASRAMTRSSPKIADTKLTLSLYGSEDANPGYRPFGGQPASGTNMVVAPFRFPKGVDLGMSLVLRTSWCDTDLTNLDARVVLDGRETRLDPATVFQSFANRADAVLRFSIPSLTQSVNELRATATYSTQRWELTVDEDLAARATWPREWPAAVQAFLGKDEGVNPDDPAIRALAEGATPQGYRMVAPFIAARNAVAAVLGKWKVVNSSTSELGPDQTLRGIRFSTDGVYGIGAGRGTAVELAATCVASLRAIGLPARIVYCLTEEGENDRGRSLARFRYICEFFLPEVGWVPFDPTEMRLKGVGNRPVTGPVKGFANVTGLRACLPLAFRLVPDGFRKSDRYATWGWAGNDVRVDPATGCSRLMLVESGRGNGKIPTMPAPVGDAGP